MQNKCIYRDKSAFSRNTYAQFYTLHISAIVMDKVFCF